MKKSIIYKTLNILLFLCVSFNVMAQRDLVFTSAVAPVTTVSTSQQFSITYTLTNAATSISTFGDGITLDVAYNPDMATIDFSYVSFSSADTSWQGCVAQPVSIPGVALTFGVNCLYQGNLSPGQSTSITANYLVSGSTIAGNYSFEALASDVGSFETDFTNNRATTVMTVSAAAVADYQLQVLSPNPLAIDTTPGIDPIIFQLDLLGATGFGSSEFVDITVPAGFTLGNFNMVNAPGFTGTATWTCIVNTAPNWQCFNSATGGGMNAGDSAIINADILTRPSTAGGPHPIVANIFDSISPAGNTAILNVNVNNPAPDLQLNTLADPGPINTFTPNVTTSFQLENMNSTIALESDVKLEVTFDNNNFTFNTATILPPLWNCGLTMANTVTCDCTGPSCASGIGLNTQYNFGLDFTSNIPTPAGTYVFGAGLIYQSTPISGVASSQTVTIGLAPTDFSIIKTAEDGVGNIVSNVSVNDSFIYKLAIQNSGIDAPVNQVKVIDVLPAGVNFSGIVPTPAGWSCTASGAGNKTIECINSVPLISGATSSEIIIPVTAGSTTGSVTNSANVTPVFGSFFTDFVTSNDSSDAVISVNAAGSTLIIAKTANQSSYVIGDDVVYTITVENTSVSNSISDLEISDLLPGNYLDLNLANVSVTANNLVGTSVFTCTFGAVIDTASCDNLASTGSLFNPGDKVEIVITATATAVGTAIANTASYSSTSFGLNGTSNTALINITTTPPPTLGTTSLSVQKSASQNGVQVSEVEKGSSFQYEVVIANTGNFGVSSLSVIDSMPAGVVVDNIVTPTGMTCNNQGQTYNCNYSQILPTNASLQVIYNVTDMSDVNTISLLNSVRAISANAPEKSDEVVVNLTGSNTNPPPNPTPNAQYTLEIQDDIDPVQQGENYNYIVTVTNTGTVVLNAIDINVLLPQDLTVNSTNTNGVACSTIAVGLRCIANEGLSMNPGEQLDVVVVNVVSQSFFGDVLVEVQANTTSTTIISDDEATTILENIAIPKADLSIAVLNTQIVTQGGQTNFDVSIDNLGFPALNPRVSIGLSGLIDTIQVLENEFWTCDVAGLNVNCQYKGTSMPFEQNSLIHFNLDLSRISTQFENIVVVATAESDTEDDFIGNNTATATISVNPTPTEGEILSALSSALDGKGNQQVNRAIQNVASYCEVSYFMALEGLCSELYHTALDGDGETINNVMEQITPNEVIGQSTSIAEIATAQFRNIGSRLSQLRTGGGSGFSSAGLNATYGNGSLPLGMLTYLNKSADESSNIDVKNDFISPWGFFVNGTVSMGSRDATGRELGFDFDSYGLTAGVDYRLSANKVVGVALGYANFDSDVDGQASLASTGVTLTGYGSFYVNDNFYVDARISMAKPDFDQSRNIDFTLGETTISRVANGSTSSSQYSVAMSAGYNFYKNSWNITPNGSFRYIKTSIDGFTETGAGGFNFSYSDQDLESMIWSAGIKVSKAISLKNGVITPQFDFDYNYESLNDGNDIEARFVAAPLGEIFIIETDSPDRTYGSAGLGFAYISSNGKQAYFNYRSVLGLQGFSRGTFNLGARFEF